MTKLLVRTYNEHNDKVLLVNPADYLRVVDELSAWLDLTFTIIATDRYTLDVEHELMLRERLHPHGMHNLTIAALPDDTTVDWHDLAQQHPIEPTSSGADIVIGD